MILKLNEVIGSIINHQIAFSNELLLYGGTNHEEAMLEILTMTMMYNEKKLAARFFRENGKEELASIFDEIGVLRDNLKQIIPEDFQYIDKLSDKVALKEYANIVLKIRDLEEQFMMRKPK